MFWDSTHTANIRYKLRLALAVSTATPPYSTHCFFFLENIYLCGCFCGKLGKIFHKLNKIHKIFQLITIFSSKVYKGPC